MGKGIHLITGRAGSGKTEFCMRSIVDHVESDPLGGPLLWIVPEQASDQSERELYARMPKRRGMLRVQVISFQRLAWRVLHETGVSKRPRLNDLGKRLLVHRILLEKNEQLQLFKRAEPQAGLVERMTDLFDEFQRYGLHTRTWENWLQAPSNQGVAPILRQKCAELSILFQAYLDALESRGLDTADPLDMLLSGLKKWEPLEETEIWMDGFHGFTPQERKLIVQLAKHTKQLHITLSMEPGTSLIGSGWEGDLFEPSIRTAKRIWQEARDNGVRWQEPTALSCDHNHRFIQPALKRLEQAFAAKFTSKLSGQANLALIEVSAAETEGAVRMRIAAHRRAEVEAAAQDIIKQMQRGAMRYRDILVLTRDAVYADLFRLVFEAYGIPFFMDEKKPLRQHPLLEAMFGALETMRTNWRVDSLFRVWKSPIILPDMPQAARDELENRAIAYGWRGATSYVGGEWPASADSWKSQLTDPLRQLQRDLANAKLGRHRVQAIRTWLEAIAAKAWLQAEMEKEERAGKLQLAAMQSQIWQHILDWLGQMETLLGDQQVNQATFERLFIAGMAGLQVAMVPPAFDQVMIGHVDRTRSFSPKISYVLGLIDGVFPKAETGDGLFSEHEREQLASNGIELAPSAKMMLSEEPYAMYQALTRSGQQLWLSYPLQNEDGKACLPSSLVADVRKALPHLKAKTIEIPSLWDVVHPRMISEIHMVKPEEASAAVLEQLKRHVDPFWRQQWQSLQSAMSLRLPAFGAITHPLAEQLYGSELRTSVSKLESYAGCPYQFYANYGLRLNPRRERQVEASDLGTLYHLVMQKLLSEHPIAQSSKLTLPPITRAALDPVVSAIVQSVIPTVKHSFFTETVRRQYHAGQVERFLQENAFQVMRQLQAGQFRPKALEHEFEHQLSDIAGIPIILKGKIDRIDEWDGTDGTYMRIIDYKSRKHPIVFGRIEAGLELQVISYLDILMKQREREGLNVHPAGFFYFGMDQKFVELGMNASESDRKQEYNKLFKMDGCIIDDSKTMNVSKAMDQALQIGVPKSDIVRVNLKKDGTPDSHSMVISPEQFEHVRKHVRTKVTDIAKRVYAGDAPASPIQDGQQVACTFCDYRPVCQFDARFGEQHVRPVKKVEKKQWFASFEQPSAEE